MKFFSNVVCSELIHGMLIFVSSHQSGCNRTQHELKTGPTIDRYKCEMAIVPGCLSVVMGRLRSGKRKLFLSQATRIQLSCPSLQVKLDIADASVCRNVKLGNAEFFFVDKNA